MMDVLVVDVPRLPPTWTILLSRKLAANLGGSLQMDLSYTTIPIWEGSFVILYQEVPRRYHVEDLDEPMNDFTNAVEDSPGNFEILTHTLTPAVDPDTLMKKTLIKGTLKKGVNVKRREFGR